MSSVKNRRIAAVKVADALNMMEGVPVSSFAKELSQKWVAGEISGDDMKAALILKHKKNSV